MQQIATPEKDSLLAIALASGASISDVAAQANIDRSTVYRKLEDPQFCRLVSEFRDRVIATALGRITDNLLRGADALAAMLDSPKEHLRIRAARALFSLAVKLRDSVDLTARVREVEAVVARKQGVAP